MPRIPIPELENQDPFGDTIEDGGGGAGDVGGAGDGDGADEVTFDDSEAEVFEAPEVVFDESEAEVFDSQECLDEIRNAKASCAESSVEAGKNSNILWGVSVAAGFGGRLAVVAAYAGLGAAAQGYMGSMAQKCANDPPRTDTGVVALFRRLPLYGPRQPVSQGLAVAYAAGASPLPVAIALSAFTRCIERFEGARVAMQAGNPDGRRNVILQAAAITFNARAVLANVDRLVTAAENYRRRLSSLSTYADQVDKMTAAEFGGAVGRTWDLARGAFDAKRTPQTLSEVEVEVKEFMVAIKDGTITPAAVAALFRNDPLDSSAIERTGQSFRALADTFMRVGRTRH
jgi:hypothetical protein